MLAGGHQTSPGRTYRLPLSPGEWRFVAWIRGGGALNDGEICPPEGSWGGQRKPARASPNVGSCFVLISPLPGFVRWVTPASGWPQGLRATPQNSSTSRKPGRTGERPQCGRRARPRPRPARPGPRPGRRPRPGHRSRRRRSIVRHHLVQHLAKVVPVSLRPNQPRPQIVQLAVHHAPVDSARSGWSGRGRASWDEGLHMQLHRAWWAAQRGAISWWSSGEVGEYRQDATVVFLARREAQFRHDRGDVVLHGPLGQPQLPCDTQIRPAFGHQPQNLRLAGTE